MNLQLKKITFSCLLPAILSLLGMPSAWCATPEIEAAKKNVSEAQARFFSIVKLPAYHHIEKLCREAEDIAADTATDEAENAASDAGGVGNKEEEEKAYREKYEAVYKQVHEKVYRDELIRKMRNPKNAVLYKDAVAPVRVALAKMRDVIPILEKHDALFQQLGLPKRQWKKGIDHAEKSLADCAALDDTLTLVERIMDDMKNALKIAASQSE